MSGDDDGSFLSGSSRNNVFFRYGEPVWSPPPFVYGIVWLLLYIGIAYVTWRAWDEPLVSRALIVANILVNLLWIPIFICWSPIVALVVLVIAVFLALGLAAQLQKISTPRRAPAQIIWYVYILWLVFATILNAQVVVGVVR